MKKIVKITTIEERRINMIEGIEEEHIYENPENREKIYPSDSFSNKKREKKIT